MKPIKYDYVFISQIPVFYKINLYNKISENNKIFVIFLAPTTLEKRASDFVDLSQIEFNYILLPNSNLQNRSKIKTSIRLFKILQQIQYEKLVLCAWDYLETWVISFLFPKRKNSFILESSIYDSKVSGPKGLIKRLFLTRISLVFASGKPHMNLLQSLGYTGEIVATNGVGLINKYKKLSVGHNDTVGSEFYLFIGRLAPEKNLTLLIDYFRKHPDRNLKIIGEGPLEANLKSSAPNNIEFLGSVDNRELIDYFEPAIALILPSLEEPWGLVVEEALFNNCYVIISKLCGVADIVFRLDKELLIDPHDLRDLSRAVEYVEQKYKAQMKLDIGSKIIESKDLKQVNCYNLNFDDE